LEADEHTLGLWHFDEGTGNEAKDASVDGNDGTLTNMEEEDWVEGKYGKGLEFDGVNEYVNCGTSNTLSFNNGDNISIEAWIKPFSLSKQLHGIVDRYQSTQQRYSLYLTYNNIVFRFYNSGWHDFQTSFNPINNINTWYLVTLTYQYGIGSSAKIFVNGELKEGSWISGNGNIGPSSVAGENHIGTYGGVNSYSFQGFIDEVRISNITRTPEEIARNYRSGLLLRNGKVELNSWKYKRTITITTNGGALTNYQIQVNLTQQNFDYSHAKNDGGDVRFYDSNGGELNYWIEEWNRGGNSKIWVNVTNVPNGNSQIWMEYGSPKAEDESDGDATFDFFDDFEKGILDNLKWNSAGAISFNSGKVIISGDPGKLESKENFGIGMSITAYSKKNNNRIRAGFGTWGDQNSEISCECDPQNSGHLFSSNGGAFEKIPITPFDNNWHHFRVDRFSNKNIGWYDNIVAESNMVHAIKKPAYFAVWNGNEMEVEWVFVRKIVIMKPTTSIGNEEGISLITDNMKSISITLPNSMSWSTLSLTKIEPANTYINVSILNAEDNSTIPDFDNLTARNINLSALNDLGITSIRLKAHFSGNGSATPSLDSWGVEWTAENAWRDSFTGDSKVAYPYGMDDHTVGYWRFEEGSGNVARDLSGNGNDGTLLNMKDEDWVDGRIGKALEFDGENDYIEVQNKDDFSINTNANLSICFWLKTSDNVSKKQSIISKRTPGGPYEWSINIESSKIVVRFSDAAGNQIRREEASISTNMWFYFCVIFTGVSQTDDIEIWKNGVESSELHSSASWIYSKTNANLGIGRGYGFGAWLYFKGIIDEVRISNITRSPEEVRQAYQAGISIHGGQVQLGENEIGPGPGSVGYWSFDEGGGDKAFDGSGNGNDGTLNNMDDNDWVDGRFGKALEFDGDDDSVGTSDIDLSGDFTIEAWIKPETLAGANRHIVVKGSSYYFYWDMGTLEWIGTYDGAWTAKARWGSTTTGEWMHIVGVDNGTNLTLYVNGTEVDSAPSGSVGSNDKITYIGAYLGIGGPFNGIIDEVSIYNRALTPYEVYNHSRLYRANATLHSSPILLPPNQTWDTFHCSRSVPDDTYLNISINDALTNESLLMNTNRTGELYLDMSKIDPIAHPSIYLQAYFESNRTETPTLYDWAVNWSTGAAELRPPDLIVELPDETSVIEDTPTKNLIDLKGYFRDIYSAIAPSRFALESVSDTININLSLNGSRLDIINMRENWTGLVHVIANCTNMYGLSTPSNEFIINVTPVDDAPAWNSAPPEITVIKGTSTISNYSLDEFVVDAEEDAWGFAISASNENISVTLDIDNHIIIEHSGSLVGELSIQATVFQSNNDSFFSNISIPIRVIENALPRVRLLSPRNGNIVTSTTVPLSWTVFDNDTSTDNITYDVYFGNISPPVIYQSDWNRTEFQLSGLTDGKTYFWYVLPRDENGNGTCMNGTWNFTVSTSRPIPTVTYLSPLHGSIMNKTSVNLAWSTENPLDEHLNFDVHLGDAPENLTKIATTRNETYLLDGLEDNTTYYWKIIPWSENITGVSVSGVWNFTVKKSFVRTYGLEIKCDVQDFNITLGTIGRFNFNVTNTGNQPERVLLSIENWLLKSVVLNVPELKLDPGEVGFFQLMISIDSSTVISDYNVVIIASLD